MKALPGNIQMAVVGFVAGFIALFLATQNIVLAFVVGAVLFGLFYTGIIKARR